MIGHPATEATEVGGAEAGAMMTVAVDGAPRRGSGGGAAGAGQTPASGAETPETPPAIASEAAASHAAVIEGARPTASPVAEARLARGLREHIHIFIILNNIMLNF